MKSAALALLFIAGTLAAQTPMAAEQARRTEPIKVRGVYLGQTVKDYLISAPAKLRYGRFSLDNCSKASAKHEKDVSGPSDRELCEQFARAANGDRINVQLEYDVRKFGGGTTFDHGVVVEFTDIVSGDFAEWRGERSTPTFSGLRSSWSEVLSYLTTEAGEPSDRTPVTEDDLMYEAAVWTVHDPTHESYLYAREVPIALPYKWVHITLASTCPVSRCSDQPFAKTADTSPQAGPDHVEPSGPFGFERGMTREQIVALVGKEAVAYAPASSDVLGLTSAPKPNSNFEKYLLVISPQGGLLKINAIGKTVQTGDSGTELQLAFTDVVTGVAKKYGLPSGRYDTCNAGAECEPQFWMMSLKDQNRRLAASWKRPTNTIDMIGVFASYESMNSGYITVSYQFAGFDKYSNLEKDKQDESY
jgi:hypothetical protein